MALPTQGTGAPANAGAANAAPANAGTAKDKTIIHSPSGDSYSITLTNGTGLQLPVITTDTDVITELEAYAKQHRGLVVVEALSTFETRAEAAAKKAAAQE